MTIELLLIFAGGLLGSSHCIGMCGGFALALGSTGRGWRSSVWRQVIYGLGRVFTYTVGGLAAGFVGWRMMHELPLAVNMQAILSIAAGVLLIVQGLHAAGLLPRLVRPTSHAGCLAAGPFAALLRETRIYHVFVGGVINGLLPCGLVYAYLALAASSGEFWRGGLTMALFGLGTMPVLALVGAGGRLLSVGARSRGLRMAAWCVVLAGGLSILRGVGVLPSAAATGLPDCPACR